MPKNSIIPINQTVTKIDSQVAIGDKLLKKYRDKKDVALFIFQDSTIQVLQIHELEVLLDSAKHKGKIMLSSNLILKDIIITKTNKKIILLTDLGYLFVLNVSTISNGFSVMEHIGAEKGNLLKIRSIEDFSEIRNNLLAITKNGDVRKDMVQNIVKGKYNDVPFIKNNNDDSIIDFLVCSDNVDIVIGTRFGRAIRFNENIITLGAKRQNGINITENDDRVVGVSSINEMNSFIFCSTEEGFIKFSELQDYRITNRGGNGIKTFNLSNKTGKMNCLNVVTTHDFIILVKNDTHGKLIILDKMKSVGRTAGGYKALVSETHQTLESVIKISKQPILENA